MDEFQSKKLEFAKNLLEPVFKYLEARHITGMIIPFIVFSIYSFYLFYKRPKGKIITTEEAIVFIMWLLTLILSVIFEYYLIVRGY